MIVTKQNLHTPVRRGTGTNTSIDLRIEEQRVCVTSEQKTQ